MNVTRTETPIGNVLRRLVALLQAENRLHIAAIMLIACAVGLWVKFTQLQLNSGFLTISRFIGRARASDLTLVEQLSFFASDLLVGAIVLPVLVIALVGLLPGRWRLMVAALFAMLLCLLYYVQLQTLGSVGRFMSLSMATDAIQWARDNPGVLSDYTSSGGVIKLVAAAVAIALVAWLAERRDARSIVGSLSRLIESGALAGVLAAGVLGAVAASADMTTFPQHRSVPESIVRALAEDESDGLLPRSTPRAELIERYRAAAALGPAGDGSVPAALTPGGDAGHDVIMFVMETGPKAVWQPDSLPAARALLNHALLAENHYTTYPYTSDAIFSILTGAYPLGRRAFIEEDRIILRSGLQPPLASAGYVGLAYLPYPDTFESDTSMYRLTGFSEVFTATLDDADRVGAVRGRVAELLRSLPADAPALAAQRDLVEERVTRDLIILEQLKADIRARKQAGQRFVAAFMPQMGHGPWFDLKGRDSVVDRGRDIALIQDQWLGEIVDLLNTGGWLESTVILVTGDHGVRTRIEDPDLPSGVITPYTYNVPLLIFAPGSVRESIAIRQRTSHVDIAPTIHGLLGSAGAEFGQGAPIWQAPLLDRRRVFLFGGEYLGADGYVEAGRFVMRQSLTGATFQNADFRFPSDSMIRAGDAASAAAAPIKAMYAMQPRLLDLLQ